MNMLPDAMETVLSGKCIALAESRELDVLAHMLEKRGAQVIRCPLVSIKDSPDQRAVADWMEQFILSPPEYFIILTGEGLKRLIAHSERGDKKEFFVRAMHKTQTITRGPKPNKFLRSIDLNPNLVAETPTTQGIIDLLEEQGLKNCRIDVQLYGENPNTLLREYLSEQQHQTRFVAPYVYASDAETGRVLDVIQQIINQEMDAIAFTSTPQWKRLYDVSKEHGLDGPLVMALNKMTVAAVGPVIRDALQESGVEVSTTPDKQYFMKPLVNALSSALQ